MSGSDGSTRDERRVVTAVFADLVGSTALGERLDPEEVKLIVGEAVARMPITAVEAFGGTVKDLAGDGVLALFGAPAAHEDDAERAVRAALRDRRRHRRVRAARSRAAWGVERLRRPRRRRHRPRRARPDRRRGRVEYAAFGDTVNTAARLQAAADAGHGPGRRRRPGAWSSRSSTGPSPASSPLKGKDRARGRGRRGPAASRRARPAGSRRPVPSGRPRP